MYFVQTIFEAVDMKDGFARAVQVVVEKTRRGDVVTQQFMPRFRRQKGWWGRWRKLTTPEDIKKQMAKYFDQSIPRLDSAFDAWAANCISENVYHIPACQSCGQKLPG